MSANVTIYEKAWSDPRFGVLARLLGSSKFDAIGRCAAVWRLCTETRTYLVSPEHLGEVTQCDKF